MNDLFNTYGQFPQSHNSSVHESQQKRGQPKINLNKLPPGFTGKKLHSIDKNQKMQEGSRKPHKHSIQNLSNIEAISEFRQMSQMLSPLKFNQQKKNNPLAPYRQFLKNKQKLEEEMGIDDSLKLEDMITIEILRSYTDSSPVKKMLHGPTMKLFVVKEEPLKNKEIRRSFQEWITIWQSKFHNSNQHIKVYSTFWNTPEGYVSIVMEYLNAGSLQNLLEFVGFLPELAIKQLIPPVLEGLSKIHNLPGLYHGALAPSQIVLNKDSSSIKLSLGLSYKVQQQQSLLNIHRGRDTLFEPCAIETPSLWSKCQTERSNNEEVLIERANDIWRLGLLFLHCALGTMEFHPQAQTIYELCKYVIEDVPKLKDVALKDFCCLLHSEQKLLEKYGNTGNSRITLLSLLSNRYSNEFLSFLCSLLKINPRLRLPIDSLLRDSYVNNIQEFKGPELSLKELLRISSSNSSYLPEEFQGQSEKKLDRLCDALQVVMQNKPQMEKMILSENSEVVQEMAHDIGLDSKIVTQRLMQVFHQYNIYIK